MLRLYVCVIIKCINIKYTLIILRKITRLPTRITTNCFGLGFFFFWGGVGVGDGEGGGCIGGGRALLGKCYLPSSAYMN